MNSAGCASEFQTKKTPMKRISSVTIALLICILAIPFAARAEDNDHRRGRDEHHTSRHDEHHGEHHRDHGALSREIRHLNRMLRHVRNHLRVYGADRHVRRQYARVLRQAEHVNDQFEDGDFDPRHVRAEIERMHAQLHHIEEDLRVPVANYYQWR